MPALRHRLSPLHYNGSHGSWIFINWETTICFLNFLSFLFVLLFIEQIVSVNFLSSIVQTTENTKNSKTEIPASKISLGGGVSLYLLSVKLIFFTIFVNTKGSTHVIDKESVVPNLQWDSFIFPWKINPGITCDFNVYANVRQEDKQCKKNLVYITSQSPNKVAYLGMVNHRINWHVLPDMKEKKHSGTLRSSWKIWN